MQFHFIFEYEVSCKLATQPYSYSILFLSYLLKIIIVARVTMIAVAENAYRDIMAYQYRLRMVYLNSAAVELIAATKTFYRCKAWVNIAIVSFDIAMETLWILGFLVFVKAYRTKKGRGFWL